MQRFIHIAGARSYQLSELGLMIRRLSAKRSVSIDWQGLDALFLASTPTGGAANAVQTPDWGDVCVLRDFAREMREMYWGKIYFS